MQITDRVHPPAHGETGSIGPSRQGEQWGWYMEPFVPHSPSRFLLPTRSRREGRALLSIGSQERGNVPVGSTLGQRQSRVTTLWGGRRQRRYHLNPFISPWPPAPSSTSSTWHCHHEGRLFPACPLTNSPPLSSERLARAALHPLIYPQAPLPCSSLLV